MGQNSVEAFAITARLGAGPEYRPEYPLVLADAAFDRPSENAADDNTELVDNRLFIWSSRSEWVNNRNYAYGYNYQSLGNSRLKLGKSGQGDPQQGFINFPVKTDHLERLSFTVMAADTLGTAPSCAYRIRKPHNTTAANLQLDQLGNHGWSLDLPRMTADGDLCDDTHRGEARSGPDPRHAGKVNFLSCDTHVDRLSLQEVGYAIGDDDAYPLPGNSLNDERSHNRFFSGSGQDDAPPPIR